MKIEQFVETISAKPSFWVKAWLFFFLLFSGKEGKELVADLSSKVDGLTEKAAVLDKKANSILEKLAVNNAACEA
jgi:hypothetical protein